MFRSVRRGILFAVIAVFAGAPVSEAVELTFDGYPSYFRTRARLFNRATFNDPSLVYGNGRKDRIFFVDSSLRLSPEFRLSENLSVTVQVDVADNMIWGGRTDQLLGGGSTLVNSGISPSDSFRGSILAPTHHATAYLDHRVSRENPSDLGEEQDTGAPVFNRNAAVDPEDGWFKVRMAYADIALPNELGFVRIGRQSFDWGLGAVSNGGHDPSSDFGTAIDRLMLMKTAEFPTGSTLTGMLFADLWTGGKALRATGAGYDGIGAAAVYNKPAYESDNMDLTLGTYIYPWIKQDNFKGGEYFLEGTGDLDRLTIYSFMMDARHKRFRLAGEYHGAWGRVTNVSRYKNGIESFRVTDFNRRDNVDINHHYAWAARLEFMPRKVVQMLGGEFGWVEGDHTDGKNYWEGNEGIDGGFVAFSPAYNVDHLLLKHILPGIYQSTNNAVFTHSEGGVQNTRYARFYVSFRLADWLMMKNQWLMAWNNETDNLFVDGENISQYIGGELETTFSFRLREGVYLDLTGSAVFAGDGLKDMFEGQAWNELVRRSNDDIELDFSGADEGTGQEIKARFVGVDGKATAPGLEATLSGIHLEKDRETPSELQLGCGDKCAPDENPAEYSGEVHRRAYRELRKEFVSQYEADKSRIWSLQTVLTVHLDSVFRDGEGI